jgi:hypothetical protein
LEENLQGNIASEKEKIQELTINQNLIFDTIATQDTDIKTLSSRVLALEKPITDPTSKEEIDNLVIEQNSLYYSGTIAISGGVVMGTSTEFDTELEIGDIFIATDSSGKDVEFQVRAFDTTTPSVKISVTPTNKTVNAGEPFKRDINRLIAKKINEIIFALRKSDILV